MSNYLQLTIQISIHDTIQQMNRTPTEDRILSILRTEGPLSPAILMARLELSQSTLFRSVNAQSNRIISLGASRNRKLAALRDIRRMGSKIPLFSINEKGKISPLGNLIALHPNTFVFLRDAESTKPRFYPGVPFFLDELRPQGFLGRAFGQKHSDLKLPQRIMDWNGDDILEAIAKRGEDLIGNIIAGAESFERYQSLSQNTPEAIDGNSPGNTYVKLAQAAIDGQPAGSSVGGEQPKFGATLRRGDGETVKVLVKFSPPGKTFAAERWRDLLICEAYSLEVLRGHGFSTAEARVLEAGGRTFLETVRFDRLGPHGRRGVISLSALENEWSGHGKNWADSGEKLKNEGIISPEALKVIRILECFGRQIANSDRHSGNLSFFWQPRNETNDEATTLAPVYDMLPMLYAPSSGGENTGKVFTLPTYDHTLLDAWNDALPMAREYWEKVQSDIRVSAEFRKIAKRNLVVLE